MFSFNPLDPAVRRDPFALYARARAEAPAFLHAGLPFRVVSIFRYEDVQATLRDDARFSNAPNQALRSAALPDLEATIPPSMLVTDGAEHTRLRGLVNKAFTPRIVSRLEGRMHALAEELVDASVAQGEADLVQTLTYPLPVTVIAEIIGIPAEHRAQFKAWSDRAVASLGVAFLGGFDEARVREQIALREEMKAYLIPLAEERKRAPRENCASAPIRTICPFPTGNRKGLKTSWPSCSDASCASRSNTRGSRNGSASSATRSRSTRTRRARMPCSTAPRLN